MDLEQAIELLKGVVKFTGTNDEKHIDLTLIPNEKRELFQKAMVVSAMSIKEGKITRDEFFHRVHLDS